MDFVDIVILGAVQGVTEFLPISSTGHLILTRELFSISDTNALAFDAILHLATAAAVFIYFSKDILLLVHTGLRKLGKLPVNERDLTLLYALLLGTIPAVVLGLLLESYIESVFRSPLLVAVILFLGSLLFIYAEWVYQHNVPQNELSPKKGLKIGFFQALALLPGMSRSGATIAGGMLLGLSRSEAARFAFLLALPVILGAGTLKLFELIRSPERVEWLPLVVGAAVAFVTGILAIHFMLSFVRKHTLWPFIWYRIILAGFIVFVFWLG